MVGGNQYVRSQNMTTSLELSPWEEWQNRVFGPINWQSENAPLYSLQNGLRKWEPSTVQNRRLRLTDTSMGDCPGDDDAVWYERDYETLPAEARACVIHGNCKKKKVFDSFGSTHISSYAFSRTQLEQSSVSLLFEGFLSDFVPSVSTRDFKL